MDKLEEALCRLERAVARLEATASVERPTPGLPGARSNDDPELRAIAGELTAVFNSAILEEYRDVLSRKELSLPVDRVSELIDTLELIGFHLTTLPWPESLPDPDVTVGPLPEVADA